MYNRVSYKNLYFFILLFVLNSIARPNTLNHFQDEIDSLINLIPKTEVKYHAEIETKYNTAEKELPIKKLNLNLRSQKKIKFLSLIIAGLQFVLFVAVLIILIARNKVLKKTKQLKDKEKEVADARIIKLMAEQKQTEQMIFAEQQINKLQIEKHLNVVRHKNRELEQLTLNIIEKNNILLKIKELLKNDPVINSENTNLYRYVKSSIDVNQYWYQFKQLFEETNPGFFDRLKISYPVLTEHDIQICTYLKAKISSKQIAQVMYVAEASVSKCRNRLRKKLGLKLEEDLYEWLDSI